jgi:hypothetical protein
MTPERERRLRDTWANVHQGTVDDLRRYGTINFYLPPPPNARPDPSEIADLVTVTCKDREVTWSAMCEGIELATYRNDGRGPRR